MTLDFFVIGLYVAAMLALGAWAMRRTRTREDYLVAGRNLGPGFYLGSMAATILGGASTIGSVRLGYLHGISAFWLCALLGMGTLGVNWLLAKPLLKLKIYTVTQVLERRYSPATRQASAVIMLAYTLMIGCTSVIAIGTIFQVLFGWSFALAALAGGAVVVLYCSLGGMWSLTLTDVVQFLIMTVGLIFILLPLSISDAGGWQAMMSQLPETMWSITGIGGDTIVTWFLIYFLGIFIGQDIWQRIFTARSPEVALFWSRASTRGAMTSMALGAATVIGFMVKDGILANTPIYYGLAVSLVGFVLVSLWSPASAAGAQQAEA